MPLVGNEHMYRLGRCMAVGNLLQAKRTNPEPTQRRSAREQGRTFTPLRIQQGGSLTLLTIGAPSGDENNTRKYLCPDALARASARGGTRNAERTQLRRSDHAILLGGEQCKPTAPR